MPRSKGGRPPTYAQRPTVASERAIQKFLECVDRGVQERSSMDYVLPPDAFVSDLPPDTTAIEDIEDDQ